jgi:hypothetical protein
LTQVFATVKATPDIRNLPANYKAVLEWARISSVVLILYCVLVTNFLPNFSLAATVFQHFLAADDSPESFASLKRIHGLMPYFMLKAALKISNPIAMIRSQLHSLSP